MLTNKLLLLSMNTTIMSKINWMPYTKSVR